MQLLGGGQPLVQGAGAEGRFEGQELAQVKLASPEVHLAHPETNHHHLEQLKIWKK